MKYKLLFIFTIFCVSSVAAEENKGIISVQLAGDHQVQDVFVYRCTPNTQCQVRCTAGQGFEPFSYQNVNRFEIAQGKDYWLLGAVYIDPIGKGHSTTGIFPHPTNCILDDLNLTETIPLVDGELIRPSAPQDVIFELQPSN